MVAQHVSAPPDFSRPDDISPRPIRVGTKVIDVRDDPYSARLRCDHPEVSDGRALGHALIEVAAAHERPRVVVLTRAELRKGLAAAGFTHEATMPGFYCGDDDCAVMGYALTKERKELAYPEEVGHVDTLLNRPHSVREAPAVKTRPAVPGDAAALARLIGETFADYPTPSDDPAYIAEQIASGTPFRLVEEDGLLLACASADLVPAAKTAELTDCATRPSARRRGLMQRILLDLMDDLRERDYPTAFTLARARVAGMNIAFKRLGFEYRGRMAQSCRIGDGFEDMNVWSRAL